MKSEAWHKGYDAYYLGLEPDDNPYEELTIEYEDWLDGVVAGWQSHIATKLETFYDES